jgi:8-oxo-dGTP diphosphatase
LSAKGSFAAPMNLRVLRSFAVQNIMLLATLCYLKRDGQTLMVHRNKKPGDIHAGKWNGLGGKFVPGETPEECVIREVREESGLEIVDPRLHGLVMFPGFKGNDWYVFVFTATEFTGGLIDSPEGELRWVPDGELEALSLWPSDKIFFGWMREGKFFSAKFVYEGEEMRSYNVSFHPPEKV